MKNQNETNKTILEFFDSYIGDTNVSSSDFSYDPSKMFCLLGNPNEKTLNLIEEHAHNRVMSNKKLSMSFYQTFEQMQHKSNSDIYIDKLFHYCTSYNKERFGFIYVPNEFFGQGEEVPEEVAVLLIQPMSKVDAVERIVSLLNSGIALDSQNVEKLVKALDSLGYDFLESFKNKEANIVVHHIRNTMPLYCADFFKYIVQDQVGTPLLVKNKKTLNLMSLITDFEKDDYVKRFIHTHGENGLKVLASEFNRFKEYFVSFKKHSSPQVKRFVNKVSKLSKKHHKPLPVNTLLCATSMFIDPKDLENASTFAILKSLNAIELEMNEPKSKFFRIRNGKTFVKVNEDHNIRVFGKTENNHIGSLLKEAGYTFNENSMQNKNHILSINKTVLLNALAVRCAIETPMDVYIPENVDYALPISEKSFIGNFPALTTITHKDSMNIGCYWENKMGANDLDLSSISIGGKKVGWNSHYSEGGVSYSGDLTDAQNGAVEFLRIDKHAPPQLIYLNVFNGSPNSDYDIIVGHTPKNIKGAEFQQMMYSGDVTACSRKTTKDSQSVLGITSSKDENVQFTFIDGTDGVSNISYGNKYTKEIIESIRFNMTHRLGLKTVLEYLGYNVHNDPNAHADINLDPMKLQKDTIINLFVNS